MKKIAFVVQRYGLEVNGGAELQCRLYAEHMTKYYQVEVLTTKAIDYGTWQDEYTDSIESINGVTVRRFGVKKTRDRKSFDLLTQTIFQLDSSREEEEDWMRRQGPYCPDLIDYIEQNAEEYDVFLFNTYLYYTTYFGLKEVGKKAILIPTAHDEQAIYLNIFRDMFTWPKGLFYHTLQEKEFVERRFGVKNVPNNEGHGGVGIDLPVTSEGKRFQDTYGVEDYILYIGRVDAHKGCVELANYMKEFQERNSAYDKLQLVYLGKEVCRLPKADTIKSLGFVDEQVKYDALAGCKLLVLPSQFESLSIVVLEAMAMGKPVLIQGNCEVVKSHVTTSNGGLYYTDYFEFEGALRYLLEHPSEADKMGKKGMEYVAKYYGWEAIEKQLCDLIERIAGV